MKTRSEYIEKLCLEIESEKDLVKKNQLIKVFDQEVLEFREMLEDALNKETNLAKKKEIVDELGDLIIRYQIVDGRVGKFGSPAENIARMVLGEDKWLEISQNSKNFK